MALVEATWYCNAGDQATTGYYAVPKWAASTAMAAGTLRRQLAVPTIGNERVFVCIVAGTSGATEPTWILTRGAKTSDGAATWQECTGQASLNGDNVNTATWAQVKATLAATLGQIIKRSGNTSYQICTTAGAMSAAEPAFSDTAGVTTTDATAVWTSLGPVSNFTGGMAPHARLANACTSGWFSVVSNPGGVTVYVGDNHAESQATTITLAPVCGASPACRFICHNHVGNYPPLAGDMMKGASISTTANSANVTMSPVGLSYWYGIAFKAGVGATTSALLSVCYGINAQTYCDNCSFGSYCTGANQNIAVHPSAGVSYSVWNNCTVRFVGVTNYIWQVIGQFLWQNTGPILESGSVIPTSLIGMQASGASSIVTLEALDLSQINTSIFGNNQSNEGGQRIIKDCKLNAAVTIQQGGVVTAHGLVEQVIRSSSTTAHYQSARFAVEGSETTETSVVRVGGATDPTGQVQSRKIVTGGYAQWLRPFRAEPYAAWNDRLGVPVIVTVCGNVNAPSLPLADEVWMEVEYLPSSSSTIGTIVTSTKSNVLAIAAPVLADASTWLNTPPGTPATLDGTPTNVTMSNGNLTATHTTTTTNSGARSTAQKSSSKCFFEIACTQGAAGFDCVGLVTAAGTYSDVVTNGANCAVMYRTGAVWSNNANSSQGQSILVNGVVVGVAADMDNKKVWFQQFWGWNQNQSTIATEDPVTNTGGISISAFAGLPLAPTVCFDNQAASSITANFGARPFIGNIPSGFTAWGSSTTLDGVPTNVTMSNGNLTATHGNTTTNSGVRSTDARTSGKLYFEMTPATVGASGDAVGLMTSAATYANMIAGTGGFILFTGGSIYSNNGPTGKSVGVGVNPWIFGVAVDFTHQKVWVRLIRWGLSTSDNPATNTGGVSISSYNATTLAPVIGFASGGSIGDNMTANFGQGIYSIGPPTGFTNWAVGAATWSPFKLTATLPQVGLPGYIHVRVRAGKPGMTYYIDPQITLG